MTKMQQSIKKYINQNLISVSVHIAPVGDDSIKVTYPQGGTTTLTMNLFGDIIDAHTRKVYAVSDLPHDLNMVGALMPQGWRDVNHA